MDVAYIRDGSNAHVGTITKVNDGTCTITWKEQETQSPGETQSAVVEACPTWEQVEDAVTQRDKSYHIEASNMAELYTQAQLLYSNHRALNQVNSPSIRLNREAQRAVGQLKVNIIKAAEEIVKLGGKVVEGKDVLGLTGPIAKNKIGQTFNYNIGERNSYLILDGIARLNSKG